MADAGAIHIELGWDGATVTQVNVRSTRPPAARLLIGRSPRQAAQIVPALFSLCGNAQAQCARAALVAAGAAIEPARSPVSLAAEMTFEHLWRLWLDWPAQFGGVSRRSEFAALGGALRRGLAAGEGRLLAESINEVLAQQNGGRVLAAAVQDLSTGDTDGLFDGLLTRLADTDIPRPDQKPRLLPDLPLAQWLRQLPPLLDADFAALPLYAGSPAEAGALASFSAHAGVARWLRRGQLLVARWLARLLALQHCLAMLAGEAPEAPLQEALTLAPGEGLARAATARGALLHRVSIDGGRITHYSIVAPTEWNFHPRGACVDALLGLRCTDPDALLRLAHLVVLSLDPCVEYRLTLNGVVSPC